MSNASERIIAGIEHLDADETLEVAGAALDYLSVDQIIELVMATLDANGQMELAARLEDALEGGEA